MASFLSKKIYETMPRDLTRQDVADDNAAVSTVRVVTHVLQFIKNGLIGQGTECALQSLDLLPWAENAQI